MICKQKITPFLWFDTQAEEAARFYVSVFGDAAIKRVVRYPTEASGKQEGSVMTVAFELEGQPFTALNGGPAFRFNEAVSLVVHCETQAEVDWFWEQLSAGGKEKPCGWLEDRYGVSWQIVPDALLELIEDPEPGKAKRAMQAMFQMKKIDIAALQRAAGGERAD